MKARWRDIVITGEALHDVQWTAPWRERRSPLHRPRTDG
jgi:hypothetical protein